MITVEMRLRLIGLRGTLHRGIVPLGVTRGDIGRSCSEHRGYLDSCQDF